MCTSYNGPMNERALTPQQAAFVEALAEDPKQNKAEAARKAGYKPKNARAMGHELFSRPAIRAAYDELVSQRFAHLGLTENAITERLAWIAFGDSRKVLNWTRNKLLLTPSADLWPQEASLVKHVTFKETEAGPVPDVAFHNPVEALIALAKIKGMLREKVDISVDARFSNAAQWAKDTLEAMLGAEDAEAV